MMKKNIFSLQKTLDLREFEKKQAEIDLGRAVARESEIQNTLNDVALCRASAVKKADGMRELRDLYEVNRYFNLLEQRKEQLLKQLAEAKIVTEQKRAVMVKAMQKCKVLEQLKEKRTKAYKKELKKEFAKEADDIYLSNPLKNKNN